MAEQMTGTGGQIKKAVAGKVEADTVSVKGVCAVANSGETDMKGASGVVMAKGKTDFTGGAGVMVSRGDFDLHAGGAPLIVSGGETHIEKGGSALIVSRKAKVGKSGYAGVVMAGKVKVEDGGKVLITPITALIMGAVFGGIFAAVRMMTGGGSRSASFGSGQGIKTKAARAEAAYEARAAMRNVRKAGRHATRAGRQMVLGRF